MATPLGDVGRRRDTDADADATAAAGRLPALPMLALEPSRRFRRIVPREDGGVIVQVDGRCVRSEAWAANGGRVGGAGEGGSAHAALRC